MSRMRIPMTFRSFEEYRSTFFPEHALTFEECPNEPNVLGEAQADLFFGTSVDVDEDVE